MSRSRPRRALIPEEVWEQEPKAVNAYIAQLAASDQLKPLNRVRAIFLGPGDAGKTLLIAAILREKVVEGDKVMTPGVAITDADPDVLWRERPADATRPTVYFWDFGGQVMAHQTHQFFLRSNCVYVIVLDGRRHSEATDAARYWLEHVRAFGEGSPVLIVGNKIDLAPVWVDIQPLARSYAGIVGFFPLSCTQAHNKRKKEFEAFRAAFESEIVKASASQAMLTESQMQVIGTLRQRAEAEAFLPREEYLKLCRSTASARATRALMRISCLPFSIRWA
jgi:GTPase SAR1 family protein